MQKSMPRAVTWRDTTGFPLAIYLPHDCSTIGLLCDTEQSFIISFGCHIDNYAKRCLHIIIRPIYYILCYSLYTLCFNFVEARGKLRINKNEYVGKRSECC